jgi:hypothetical protein
MMVERVRNPDARAPHDGKAGGIDSRKLVKVSASKILPTLVQIAQFAGKDACNAGLRNRFFPAQGYVPGGIPIQKCKCLDDTGTEV